MDHFADLSLALTSTDDPAEDVAGIMRRMMKSRVRIGQEEFLPACTASADTVTASGANALVSRLKILHSETHDAASEATTLSVQGASALLMQLRVTVATSTTWRTNASSKAAVDSAGPPPLFLKSSGAPQKGEKVKSTLNSAAAWNANGAVLFPETGVFAPSSPFYNNV
ncbi:hypothetical protein T484DRAFT_1860775 [Baffinella frigidus]|nr:hypothetical protein T484DRAFT_1860775 [Cryptophyta sp. CCMP2293]